MEYEVRLTSATDLGVLWAERARLANAMKQSQMQSQNAQEACSEMATYEGYDADTGLHTIRVGKQTITRPRSVTSGGFSIGQPIDTLCTSVIGGLPYIAPLEEEEELFAPTYNFLIGYYLEPDGKTFLGGDRSPEAIFDGTTAQLQVAAFGNRRVWGAIDAEQLSLNGNISNPAGAEGALGYFVGHCCSFWSRLDGSETSSGSGTRINYSYSPRLIDSLGNQYIGSGSGLMTTSISETETREDSSFSFSAPILPDYSLSSSGGRSYTLSGGGATLEESSTLRSIMLINSELNRAIVTEQSHTYSASGEGDGMTTETYSTSGSILFIGEDLELDETPALVSGVDDWEPTTGSFSTEVVTGSYSTGGSNAVVDIGKPNIETYNTRLAAALNGMPVMISKLKSPGSLECWKGIGTITSVTTGSNNTSRLITVSITEIIEAPFDSMLGGSSGAALYSTTGSVYELISHIVPSALLFGELPQSRRTTLINGLGNANPGTGNYHWKGNKIYIVNNQVESIGDRISKNYADVFTLTGNRFIKSRMPVSGFQQRLRTSEQAISGTPSAFYIP
jgi:hypothetical protein